MIDPRNSYVAVIKVVGVGGGGINTISRMVHDGVQGVEFISINTDAQSLLLAEADNKLIIGKTGLGAGSDPEVGRQAALESRDAIAEVLKGADMVFITAGKGGGTGTGAAPIVADIARELSALTVGVVTRPFTFEGLRRSVQADKGISELRENVDCLIVIPNDKLLEVSNEDTSLIDSFRMADAVLKDGIQGITDLIIMPGLIILDFADVKSIISNAGTALFGSGEASGENRSIEAAKNSISSPLLEYSIEGASGILLNITGGPDLKLFEVNQAAEIIRNSTKRDADIIFGAVLDENRKDSLKVTVIATGFDEKLIASRVAPKEEVSFEEKVLEETEEAGEEIEEEEETKEDYLDIPSFLRKKNQ